MDKKDDIRRRMIEAGADMEPSHYSEAPIDDPDNPEWTDEDFERAVKVEDLPPAEREAIYAAFPNTRRRGSQKTPTKVAVSIRLSREVVAHYKATGPGWQRRIDEDLRRIVKR